MMPGVPKEVRNAEIDDREIARIEAIIRSMTPRSGRTPTSSTPSRRTRIARGSGTDPAQVSELVKQFKEVAKMMKRMGGVGSKKHGQVPPQVGQGQEEGQGAGRSHGRGRSSPEGQAAAAAPEPRPLSGLPDLGDLGDLGGLGGRPTRTSVRPVGRRPVPQGFAELRYADLLHRGRGATIVGRSGACVPIPLVTPKREKIPW